MPEIIPFSADTEIAALGSMFLDENAMQEGISALKENDFHLSKNRLIFKAMQETVKENGTTDVALVGSYLSANNQYEQIGGLKYLAYTATSVGCSVNIRHYINDLKKKAYFRQCIENAQKILSLAYKQDEIALSAAINNLDSSIENETTTLQSLSELLKDFAKDIDEKREKGEKFFGLKTGFIDLDVMLGGLKPSDLYIVAGRPAMGKTSFALDIARNSINTLEDNKSVLIFSLEMNARDISARLACANANMDNAVITLKTPQKTWDRFKESFVKDSKFNINIANKIFVDDSPSITAEKLRNICNSFCRKSNKQLGLIVIDYIQLMEADFTGSNNRTQELTKITRKLKLLAKEFNCPVIAISQLSRSTEARENKRPMLSDLRESGSIEQDADVVMFVYREDYYFPDTPKKGVAEVIISKNRKGPTGNIELAWLPYATTFRNLGKLEPTQSTIDGFHHVDTKIPWG